MLDRLFAAVSPHLCHYCSRTGALICQYCEYDIIKGRIGVCIVCGSQKSGQMCAGHTQPYQKAWCFGERKDALEYLINELKLECRREAASGLARLLNAALPELPPGTVIVPIPTAGLHRRQRGFDHTLLLAKYFGKMRGLPVERLLLRNHNYAQRTSNKKERLVQAQQAFFCPRPLDSKVHYLLLDDVVTTGATVKYGARALRRAGARHIMVGAVAYEPLD